MRLHLYIQIITSAITGVRRKICDDLISKLSSKPDDVTLSSEFVTEMDPAELTRTDLSTFVKIDKPGIAIFDENLKNMHIKCVSNAVKHQLAIRKLHTAMMQHSGSVNSSRQPVYMILEDDVLFRENVLDALIKSVEKRPSNADIFLLGQSDGSTKISMVDTASKLLSGCESYMLSENALRILVDKYLPVRFITPVHICYIANVNKLNIYMNDESIFIDGSKFGVYISVLSADNTLPLNNEFNAVMKLIVDDTPYDPQNSERQQQVTKMLSTIKFNNHPAMLTLQGLHEAKMKNYEAAKRILNQAYQLSQQNDCIINSDTFVLKSLISIHKYLQ